MKHMGHIISGAAEDSTESAASAQALFSTAHFSDTVALGRSGQHRLRYFVDTILLALWAQSWVLFLERDLKVIPAHYHCILKTLHVYVCTLPLHTEDFTCLCLHTTTAYWRLYMSMSAHYHCILKTLHVYVCTQPLHTEDFTCLHVYVCSHVPMPWPFRGAP